MLPWQNVLLGVVCGLFAAEYSWPATLAVTAVGVFLVRGREVFVVALGFALGVALGLDRSASSDLAGRVAVQGTVSSVRTSPGQRLVVLADELRLAVSGEPLSGVLLWTWENPPAIPETGQRFEAVLRVRELRGRANFGMSDSETYWRRHGVTMRSYSRGEAEVRWLDAPSSMRGRLVHAVTGLVPDGISGAVIRAVLFGDRLLLDPTFMDRVRRAGLAHSLALSGLHLGLVAGLGFGLAWGIGALCPALLLRCPRQKLGVLLALPFGGVYLWLGAFTPSLTRAGIMLAVMAVYLLLGRVRRLQDSLFVAVLVLVVVNPWSVYEMGLQFSVLAVAGMVLFLPGCSRLASRLNAWGWIGEILRPAAMLCGVTLCANALMLPVLAAYFGELTVHLYLNLFWLPVLGVAVLPLSFLGLTAVVLGVPDAVATALFVAAGQGVDALDAVLAFLDSRGWLEAHAVLRPQGMEIVGFWMVLLAAPVIWMSPRNARALAAVVCGVLLLGAPSVQSGIQAMEDRVELTVLDTGMSQAVSIRTSRGRSVLVDGGGSWNARYDLGRFVVGPALTAGFPPRVDMVLLSHVDADHVRGLFHILEHFTVGWFGWTGLVDDTWDSTRLLEIVNNKGHEARILRAGDRVEIEEGLVLEVLHPPPSERGMSENTTSLVLRLIWNGRGLAVLPGDADASALNQVVSLGGDLSAEVLVLPHHGSKTSVAPRFFERVGARWAVAACGWRNRFGFPHPRIVALCGRVGSTLLTTAENGAVRLIWRGNDMAEVRTARPRSFPGTTERVVSLGGFR